MRSRVRRHSLARGNNITDHIPSTCLAGKPAAINVACVRATDAPREAVDQSPPVIFRFMRTDVA